MNAEFSSSFPKGVSSPDFRGKALSGGVTGSPWNLIPVVLFPMLVGIGFTNIPESGNEPVDLDVLAIPVTLSLILLMGFLALRTVRSARMNPDNY